MNHQARIEAAITFLPESEGGRGVLPASLSGGGYMPHLVVGDPNKRRAIPIGDEVQEPYLGVAFVSGPEKVEPGEAFLAELLLMYWPHPMYESLVPGATFTIREGPQVVGYGQVQRVLVGGAA